MMQNLRVTRAIGNKVDTGLQHVDSRLIEDACNDGRRMHEIVYDFVHGNTRDDLTMQDARRVGLFMEWWEQFQKQHPLILAEEDLYSERYKYGGRPDMICKGAVVDLKRRACKKLFDALQCGGYNNLSKENGHGSHRKWLIVSLPPEGPLVVTNVYNRHAEGLFLSLVQAHHHEARVARNLRNYFGK